METTFDRVAERSRDNGNNADSLTGERSARRRSAAASEWRDLVADVEDLLRKVAHVSDAEIAQVRERVQRTLASYKSSASEGVRRARGYAQDATNATEEYVRESPWTAVGLAAAVGVLIGFMASRR
jgi:ElaB/YqjD/DUF883 family membrane-anchored ribosome-binding protein